MTKSGNTEEKRGRKAARPEGEHSHNIRFDAADFYAMKSISAALGYGSLNEAIGLACKEWLAKPEHKKLYDAIKDTQAHAITTKTAAENAGKPQGKKTALRKDQGKNTPENVSQNEA